MINEMVRRGNKTGIEIFWLFLSRDVISNPEGE